MNAVKVSKFGDPSVLETVQTPMIKPSANEVLIKVAGAGINPVDTYIRSGVYAAERLPKLPFTPGGDIGGVVVDCGSNVSEFKTGDHVYTVLKTSSGGYAEYATSESDFTFKLPSQIGPVQGCAIGVPYFTAYRALVTIGQAVKHEKVLIHGASGGVGIAALQIAQQLGLDVYGTASSQAGLNLIEKHGAKAYNHRNEGYLEELKNEKFDLIIEMLANVNLAHDTEMLKPKGRIMLVGNRGEVTINPRFMMMPETSIRGVALWNITNDEMAETAKFIEQMAESDTLKPVLGEKFTLDNAQQAHIQTIEKSGCIGKKYFDLQ